MNKDLIIRMQSQFDQLAQTHPEELHLEFWFARDLQEPLGYARWENFLTAIQRAIDSCKTTGYEAEHHFRGVTKMVPLGSGAERSIEDFMLTRYAFLGVSFWGSGASSQHFSDRESGGREKSRAFRMRCATIPSELWFLSSRWNGRKS